MKQDELEDIIFKAAIVAMVASAIVAIYLVWLTSQESYSALYIYPGTYSNYINASELPKEISFKYGIKNYETGDRVYKVTIFLGNLMVKSKEIKVKKGETFEEEERIVVPKNITFPVKVKITAEVDGTIYEAHFWLKETPY